MTIHRDTTLGRVVEARDEADERRLPRARRADERGRLARIEGRRDVREDERSFVIPERHVLEGDAPLGRGQRHGAGPVLDLGRGVEQREDAVGRPERLLDLRPLARETADGSGDHPRIQEERHELAGGRLAADHLMAAVPEHDDRRREAEEPDEREQGRGEPRPLEDLPERHHELVVETRGLVLLARERLDRPHLGDRLLEDAHGLALRVLRFARDRADPPPEVLADQPDRRRDDEGEEREPPVHHEDHDEAADEREDLAEDRDDRLGDDAVHERRVARHVRHELTRLATSEERERQRLQVPDDLHPQVEDHALAGPGHHVLADSVDHRADEQDRDEPDHELVEER